MPPTGSAVWCGVRRCLLPQMLCLPALVLDFYPRCLLAFYFLQSSLRLLELFCRARWSVGGSSLRSASASGSTASGASAPAFCSFRFFVLRCLPLQQFSCGIAAFFSGLAFLSFSANVPRRPPSGLSFFGGISEFFVFCIFNSLHLDGEGQCLSWPTPCSMGSSYPTRLLAW